MYNQRMVKINVGKNDEGQRLDRFLRKYYGQAPLSKIYKMIRKDIKVNGKRCDIDASLCDGDEIVVYVSREASHSMRSKERESVALPRNFTIAYEDEHVLVAVKPFGLLTHGDKREKKNTLANQVCNYLIEKGEYLPNKEQSFVPAPANRLDRNTTGLVLFGKDSKGSKELNQLLRHGQVDKYYVTVLVGELEEILSLCDYMQKDETHNITKVTGEGKEMRTLAMPIAVNRGFTFAQIQILTGRAHQVRSHMAHAGFPLLGDTKYGNSKANMEVGKRVGLTTQLLHAETIIFRGGSLFGKEIHAPLPRHFRDVLEMLFPNGEDFKVGRYRGR